MIPGKPPGNWEKYIPILTFFFFEVFYQLTFIHWGCPMCITDIVYFIFIVNNQLNILKQPMIIRSSEGTPI